MAIFQNLMRTRRRPVVSVTSSGPSTFVDILKRRQIQNVVWFHTDHWEPWGEGIDDNTAARVRQFLAQAKTSPLADKMTLFYLDGRNCRLMKVPHDDAVSVPGDVVEMVHRSDEQDELTRELVGQIRDET